MTLPTHHQDVWKPATDTDKLKALALLGGLPSVQTSSADRDEASFHIALEGVTQHGLFEAVKAVLQGKLGHAFFPSPPELRMLCDKMMEHHEAMRERIARQERIRRETPPEMPPLTPEQQARREQIMANFRANRDRQKAAEEEARIAAERADIRARYGLTPEAVANIPDAPLPANWTRPTVKSA